MSGSFLLLNTSEKFLSARIWKVSDHQPHALVVLLEAKTAAGQEVTPEILLQVA